MAVDRSSWPIMVQLGLWGLPTPAWAWTFFWLSLVLAVTSVAYGFVNPLGFIGGGLVFAALWYYLAIRWVETQGSWFGPTLSSADWARIKSEVIRSRSFPPFLSGAESSIYPNDARCPVCGGDFSRGFAYLAGGALLLSPDGQNSVHPDRLRMFMDIGFHGRDPEMRDSAGGTLVSDLHGGQFDMNWCSIGCMREWLLDLLRKIEAEAGGQ